MVARGGVPVRCIRGGGSPPPQGPPNAHLTCTASLLPMYCPCTAVHNEYCETPEDFIARRTRLAFLDKLACEQALPRVSCLSWTHHKHWHSWRGCYGGKGEGGEGCQPAYTRH